MSGERRRASRTEAALRASAILLIDGVVMIGDDFLMGALLGLALGLLLDRHLLQPLAASLARRGRA